MKLLSNIADFLKPLEVNEVRQPLTVTMFMHHVCNLTTLYTTSVEPPVT